jgi:esterase/lipase superfamily enzyme
MISSRKDFWSSTETADDYEVRDVTLTDASLGAPITRDQLWQAVRGKRVLLLIHGYNNEEDDVVRAYDIIERKLRANPVTGAEYDVILGYTWPGGENRLDYFGARNRASAVSLHVARLLRELSRECTLDVMTHSMGTRVALLALPDEAPHPPMVRNLFTLAAAVDNESIQYGQKHYVATQACQRFFAFHSKYDQVLSVWYATAEFNRALGQDGPEDPAIILQRSPHVRVVNCKNRIRAHGDYKQCVPLYDHLAKVLSGQPEGQAQYVTLV